MFYKHFLLSLIALNYSVSFVMAGAGFSTGACKRTLFGFDGTNFGKYQERRQQVVDGAMQQLLFDLQLAHANTKLMDGLNFKSIIANYQARKDIQAKIAYVNYFKANLQQMRDEKARSLAIQKFGGEQVLGAYATDLTFENLQDASYKFWVIEKGFPVILIGK
jgi:hypothetical protein